MKQLLLMRHAKSDWAVGTSDIARPLNERGIKAAPFMGEFIRNQNLLPDAVYSSPAVRAKTTAEMFCKSSGFSNGFSLLESFYFGSQDSIVDIVKNIPDEYQRVLLVGHNPTWSDLVAYFCGVYSDMTTASVAVLNLKSGTWKNIERNSCSLEHFFKPSDLM